MSEKLEKYLYQENIQPD